MEKAEASDRWADRGAGRGALGWGAAREMWALGRAGELQKMGGLGTPTEVLQEQGDLLQRRG